MRSVTAPGMALAGLERDFLGARPSHRRKQ
jgi:hypothetical protein